MVQIIKESSFGGNIGAAFGRGLGAGLESLAQHKMDKLVKEKEYQQEAKLMKQLFPDITQEEAYNFARAPESVKKILLERGVNVTGGQQPQYGSEGLRALQAENPESEDVFNFEQKTPEPRRLQLGLNEAQQLKLEQRKDKLRPDLNYLEDLQRTINELRGLIDDKEDPVKFGYGAAIGSNIPVIGSQLLGANTGTFNALSNKFHTDAVQNQKGVRSVYHVKILGASKPGLDKSKDQNKKILDHWQKVIDEKKSKFLKAHPEFKNEISESKLEDVSTSSQKEPAEGTMVEQNGIVFKRIKNQWVPQIG